MTREVITEVKQTEISEREGMRGEETITLPEDALSSPARPYDSSTCLKTGIHIQKIVSTLQIIHILHYKTKGLMLFRAINGDFFDSHTKQIRVNAPVAICTVSYDTAGNTGS